jgi:hypothetical protein
MAIGADITTSLSVMLLWILHVGAGVQAYCKQNIAVLHVPGMQSLCWDDDWYLECQ